MNITREEAEPIINKYIDREFDKIKAIDFPPLREHPITEKQLNNEFEALKSRNDFRLTNVCDSKLVSYFHNSIIYANRYKKDSPYEFWNKLKNDKELFRKFYSNRLRCSDWFKEHNNMKYLLEGHVPDFIYGIGLTTSMSAPKVSSFSPKLAKMLILTYLNEYDEVFDPFSGFSGRMLGTLAAGKHYIGQDLNTDHIKESNAMLEFLKEQNPLIEFKCDLKVQDIFKDKKQSHQCLFTCSPYNNIESWNGDNDKNLDCDGWIDVCLDNYDCDKYLFVVDDNVKKYKNYIVSNIINTSHIGANTEYILLIKKEDLCNLNLVK